MAGEVGVGEAAAPDTLVDGTTTADEAGSARTVVMVPLVIVVSTVWIVLA